MRAMLNAGTRARKQVSEHRLSGSTTSKLLVCPSPNERQGCPEMAIGQAARQASSAGLDRCVRFFARQNGCERVTEVRVIAHLATSGAAGRAPLDTSQSITCTEATAMAVPSTPGSRRSRRELQRGKLFAKPRDHLPRARPEAVQSARCMACAR
jgi:hypothetical protein